MSLRSLPLIAAVVPFVGVTTSYAIASHLGLVPTCIPYIEGCTSISATGRYAPASYLFRAVQLPLAAVLFVIWLLSSEWLKSLGHDSVAQRRTIMTAGTIGAIALIVYVSFLGTQQPFYEFMRRFGIYFYFLGTAIAQLTLALALRKIGHARASALLWLAVAPFALGILNLATKPFLDDPDPNENRIEWIAALLMQLYYLFLWLAWRATGFQATVHSDAR